MKSFYISKTNSGLLLFLVLIVTLTLLGKLTQEAVDAIKWLGASFFLVRTGANVSENLGKKE
jgi:hypothetical protein